MKRSKRKTKKIRKIVMVMLIFIIAIVVIKNFNKEEKIEENSNTEEVSIKEVEPKKEENKEEQQEIKTKLQEKLANGKTLGNTGLPILMYHFFYDKNNTTGKDGNWIEISNFEEHIKYLAQNDFYFPTWDEVEAYIDNTQELPEKSVVITVDDGDPSFFELAVPILQKYKVPATSFVIVYWYGNRAEDKQEYVDYQSHSYDMHKAGANGKGVMLSWDYNKIKDDILLSKDVLGGANIFCYPFGQYNDLGMKVIKENGYNLAVTTEGRKSNKRSFKI